MPLAPLTRLGMGWGTQQYYDTPAPFQIVAELNDATDRTGPGNPYTFPSTLYLNNEIYFVGVYVRAFSSLTQGRATITDDLNSLTCLNNAVGFTFINEVNVAGARYLAGWWFRGDGLSHVISIDMHSDAIDSAAGQVMWSLTGNKTNPVMQSASRIRGAVDHTQMDLWMAQFNDPTSLTLTWLGESDATINSEDGAAFGLKRIRTTGTTAASNHFSSFYCPSDLTHSEVTWTTVAASLMMGIEVRTVASTIATPPISVRSVAVSSSAATASSFNLGSMDFGPNELIYIVFQGGGNADPTSVVQTGGIGAFTKIASAAFNTVGAPVRRQTVWRAMSVGTDPPAGSVVVTFGGGVIQAAWHVYAFTGAFLAEGGGSAIGQVVTATGDGALSGLVNIAAPGTDSALIAAFSRATKGTDDLQTGWAGPPMTVIGPGALGAGAYDSATLGAESANALNNLRVQWAPRPLGATSITHTFQTATDYAGSVVEILPETRTVGTPTTAAATAAAPVPTILVSTGPAVAASTAAAVVPTLEADVLPAVAASTASAPAAVVRVSLLPAVAGATATAPLGVVQVTILPVVANGTASGVAPTVAGGGSPITISPSVATATASALAVGVSVKILPAVAASVASARVPTADGGGSAFQQGDFGTGARSGESR